MRRLLLPALSALAIAPSAAAAPPGPSIRISAHTGSVPFAVDFAARGGAVSYRWELGDGATAKGPRTRHTYGRPGSFTATLVATSAAGTARRTRVVITALRLSLAAPRTAVFDEPVRFRGTLVPAPRNARVTLLRRGRPVATSKLHAGGRFRFRTRLRSPGPYSVRFRGIRSEARSVVVRPVLEARLVGAGVVGSPLRLIARLRPAGAGRLRVQVWRGGRRTYSAALKGGLELGTPRPTPIRVRLAAVPRDGFAPVSRTLTRTLVQPELALGASGPSVRVLEQRLASLHYAIRNTDGSYGLDTYEAVLAFQKVEGLEWTGKVDAGVWRALARAKAPSPRNGGSHIEVDKGRQVLYIVRGGRVERVVHVSTGATGNTPVGRWSVYRKVAGFDWVLYYPMYFLRGFAIHGYPSVPAYPASHGCVRVPMWIAQSLYDSSSYGQTIYVY